MSQGAAIAIRLSFRGLKSKIEGEATEVRNGTPGGYRRSGCLVRVLTARRSSNKSSEPHKLTEVLAEVMREERFVEC